MPMLMLMLMLCMNHDSGGLILLPLQGPVRCAMHVESNTRGISEGFPAQV